MHPAASSIHAHHRATYCSQTRSLGAISTKNPQDVLHAIDRILSRTCLCQHDIDEISFFYRRIDHLEQGMENIPEQWVSSRMILERVQNKIKEILSASDCSPENFIALYHLSRFPFLAPPNTPLTAMLLAKRKNRNKGEELSSVSIAKCLPYCVSEADFAEDLKVLIGPGQNDSFVKDIIDRPMKILQFDAKLREKRKLFLDTQGPDAYPAYLDELLEGGFLYLYEHLLNMTKCKNLDECEKESKKVNASTLSQILLEARQAIIARVEQEIPSGCANIVFLVGNTGSGKSTTLAFLNGEPLKRKGNTYELSNQKNLIGHSLTHSQTFLPNVRVIEEVAYIDFPGFNDTRGFLIDWGVELAFKALIARYHPKIMIVESIIALRGSRGGHVSKLGQDLQRLLGTKSSQCQLALTQYLQMREFGDLEGAQAQKNRLEGEIQQLEGEIKKREYVILRIQERQQEENRQKIQKLETKIHELEEEIDDLESQEATLTSREQRLLISSKKELKTKREKLANLEAPAPHLNEQIQSERREIQLKQEAIQVKSKEIIQLDQDIQKAQKNIEGEECSLLSTLGIRDAENQIIRLDYLDQLSTLDACRQSLTQARKVSRFCLELRLEHKAHLIQLLTGEFASKALPPPKEGINILDLQSRILETSLINVLTAESFPEIGQFLHLSEMDPGCIKTMDKELVEQFTDLLIRLIVTAPVRINGQNAPLLPIEELIRNFNAVVPIQRQGSLPSDWASLQKAVLFSSRKGATTWAELQENCRFEIENRLDKIQKIRDNHLKEWDDWACRILRIPVKLPEFIYRSYAQFSANKLATEQAIPLHEELHSTVKKLNGSLRQIKDLEKVIVYRDRIDQAWESCQFSSSEPSQFMSRIEKAITEVSQIYNQGTGNEQGGPWEHRIDAMQIQLDTRIKGFSNQAQLDGFLIELMMLEIIERDQCTGEAFIESALALAKALSKQEETGARIILSALNATRQREAAKEWDKLLVMAEENQRAVLGNLLPEAVVAGGAVAGLAAGRILLSSGVSSAEIAIRAPVGAAVGVATVAKVVALETTTEYDLEKVTTKVSVEKILKFADSAMQAAVAIEIKAAEEEAVEAARAWQVAFTTLETSTNMKTEAEKERLRETLLVAFVKTEIVAKAEENFRFSLEFEKMTLYQRTYFLQKNMLKQSLGVALGSFYLTDTWKIDISAALIKRAKVRQEMVHNWIFETSLAIINKGLEYNNPHIEDLVQAVKEINNGLAQKLGLDLRITLHRFLFLAVLDKNRYVEKTDAPVEDEPMADGFEREV